MLPRGLIPLLLVAVAIAGGGLHAMEPCGPWQQVFPVPTRASLAAVAYGDGRFVAVGREVALASEDGVVWTDAVASPDGAFESVVWAGDRFVAVGSAAQQSVVATSSDGRTWSTATVPGQGLDDVAWDGRLLIAVGGTFSSSQSALVLASEDGGEWSEIAVPAVGRLNTVAVGERGWVSGGRNAILRSDDGQHWEAVSADTLFDVLWDGGRFVASGAQATLSPSLLTSSDGVSWSRQEYPAWSYGPADRLAWNGQQLLLTGGASWHHYPLPGEVATSPDGVVWSGPVATPFCLADAVWAEGLWVAVGYDGLIGTSSDGLVWRWSSPGDWSSFADVASNGSTVVAVGGTSTPYIHMGMSLVSADLVSWSPSQSWSGFPLSDVAWDGSQWVAVGSFGEVVVSPDGSTWTSLRDAIPATPGGGSQYWQASASSPDRLVVVGTDGATSALVASTADDGATWELQVLPELGPLYDIIWTGSGFAAVGQGATAWSEVGLSWSFAANEQPLWQVAFAGRRLVAVGATGSAAWSDDGREWHEVATGLAADLGVLAWAGDRWVAGTWDGALVESRDGESWSPAEPFPWSDLSGLAWTGSELVGVTYDGVVARRRCGDNRLPEAAPRLVVPVAARRPGVADTLWRSDLAVTAPGDGAAEVYLGFVPAGAAAPSWRRFLLPAGGQLDLDDVVGRSFSHDEAAGLLLVASEQPVAAVSRSFTAGDEGSFGELFPALAASELVPPGGAALLPMLAHDARFRTNLGFANPGSEPLALRVELRDASGAVLGVREVELPPLGWVQDNGILADLTPLPVADAYAVVTADEAAPFIAYASVVDAGSGDPTLILPAAATSTSVVVPAVAHAAGVAGTAWRSDVAILNPGNVVAEYRLELLSGEVVASAPFTLAAGEARRHADVVASVFARSGSAALRVVALSGEVAVVSRTFTAGDNGSFGQGVPAVAVDAPAEPQLLTLPSLAESEAFRTNLGLVNGGDDAVTAQVTLHRGDGSVVASFAQPVPAASLVSLNRPFAHAGVKEMESGYAVVRCDQAGARLRAWASVVDNASGDPSFVLAR